MNIKLPLLWLVLLAPALHAQYYPHSGPYGYSPYGYSPYGGAGGYQAGTAKVVEANGQYMKDAETARIQREQANQAKIDTKKKSFDQMMYEKANTPSYGEDAGLINNQRINRMMIEPTPGEIRRGDTLNLFMPYISSLSVKGAHGAPMPLDSELLREVNVSTGPTGTQLNLGMLIPGKELEWPVAIQGPKKAALQQQTKQAVSQIVSGSLDLQLYQSINKNIEALFTELRTLCFVKEVIDSSAYLTGRRFLESLQASVRDLAKPGAKAFLTSAQGPQGGNVPELVRNMTKSGLSFAAANPGDDAAYFALHSAFVSYIQSAQAASGFQLTLRSQAPPPSLSTPPTPTRPK